jgi:hypothetical protein
MGIGGFDTEQVEYCTCNRQGGTAESRRYSITGQIMKEIDLHTI